MTLTSGCQIERAYNRMDCFMRDTHRVSADDRLRVTSVHTGNSLETILAGSAPIIFALAFLIRELSKAHLMYWQTEKTKWDARLAEKHFRREGNQEIERRIQNALLKEDRNLIKALNGIRRMQKQIANSPRITSVEIRFGSENDQPEFERPKRAIKFDDD